MRIAWSVAIMACALSLSSCGQMDRPYFLRFWEYNRLASQKERAQKHLNAAEKFARSAVNYAEQLGSNDFRLAISLDDLAQILLLKHKSRQAEHYLDRAQLVLKRAQSTDPKGLVHDIVLQEQAYVLCSLGDLYFEKEDFEKALEAYTQSRQILSKWCAQDRVDQGNPLALDFVKACWGQAKAAQKLRDPQQARTCFRQALLIADANEFVLADEIRQSYSELLKSDPNSNADELDRIGAGRRWADLVLKARQYYLDENYAEAKKNFAAAMALARRMPAGELRAALACKGMADCCRKSGELEPVVQYDLEALTILKRMSNPSYSLMDTIYAELAGYLELLNRPAQEQESLKEQLQLRKAHYATRQTETLADLALFYFKQKDFSQAKQYAQEGLLSMQANPASNRSSAAACFKLSDLFFSFGDFANAEKAIRGSIRITRDVLQLNDGRTPLALIQLANILALEGKQAESEMALQEATLAVAKLSAKKQRESSMAVLDLVKRHQAEFDSDTSRSFAKNIEKWIKQGFRTLK